jgi:hypothetical protein
VPSISWGSNQNGSSWSAGTLYVDGINLPVGRAMANGSQAVLITDLFAYVGGYGGNRNIYMSLGNAVTGVFTVGQSGAVPPGTGWVDASDWLVQGGSARFSVVGPSSGGLYFGHGGPGTTVGPSQSWAGALGGAYIYAQSPSEPTILGAANITPTSMLTQFGWAGDDGGAGVTGFRVQFSPDPSFGSDVRQLDTTVGQNTFDGLVPGRTYYYRVAARNAVTNTAGTFGPWSGTASARTLSGGYVGDGSSWPSAQMFVGDGTSWNTGLVYVGDGTNWNPAQ